MVTLQRILNQKLQTMKILHVNTEESNEEETSFNGSCEEREEAEIKEIFPENTIDSEKLVEEVQTEVEANIGSCIEDESNVETETELVKEETAEIQDEAHTDVNNQ